MRRIHRLLFTLALAALVPLSARCNSPEAGTADTTPKSGHSANQRPPAKTPAPADSGSPVSDKTADAEPESETPTRTFDGPAYLIKYNFPADQKLYYLMEHKYVDHGGVPPILTYTTSIEDKRTVIQTRAPAAPGAAAVTPGGAEVVTLQWECARYEARETGMKDVVTFDSLRDSYARAEIRELGAIPGSKITFDINPRTGETSNRRILPNRSTGPITRRRLSRTTMKCALNDQNLSLMMDDLGPLFLPKRPVHVGETWKNSRSEEVKSFGRSYFDFEFTLVKVEDRDEAQVGTISIEGQARLVADPAATSRPATRGRPNDKAEKPREFKIDDQACSGMIEFDIKAGQLISMELRRKLDLSASLESDAIDNMRLETGSEHIMSVKVDDKLPRAPIIAGGPKPPANDPPEPTAVRPRTGAARRNAASTQPTTQPFRPLTPASNGSTPNYRRPPVRTDRLNPNGGPAGKGGTAKPSPPGGGPRRPTIRRTPVPQPTSKPAGAGHPTPEHSPGTTPHSD